MLWNSCEGDPSLIPRHYLDHLNYRYSDGDVSLAPLLSRFEFVEDLEPEEIEEAVELLGKVTPEDWPFAEDVLSVDVSRLLYESDDDEPNPFEFVEDNLGTSEKIQKGLARVIESVFGEEVKNIRSKSGKFPNADNNFLQEEDGTFAGTFKHGNHTFEFEIAPTEGSWLCTYRLDEPSLENLPPLSAEEDDDVNTTQRVRNRGWN